MNVTKAHYQNPILLQKETDHVDVVDQRKIIHKIIDFTRAVFNHIATLFQKCIRRIQGKKFSTPVFNDGNLEYQADSLPWKNQESAGLYMFIHGLNGSPTDWGRYTKRIGSNATVFTPNVFAKGNVSLRKAAEPLLDAVRDYLREHPGKPIHLFGTSNGSRIAAYIENHLSHDELGDSSLRIISIAGVLKGTTFVNTLEKFRLTPLARLDPELQEELKWESDVAKRTLDEWGKKQKIWQENNKDVRHFFCATLEDELVRPIKSSLFNSDHTINTHKVFRGQTHISIVEKACSEAFDWLDDN